MIRNKNNAEARGGLQHSACLKAESPEFPFSSVRKHHNGLTRGFETVHTLGLTCNWLILETLLQDFTVH